MDTRHDAEAAALRHYLDAQRAAAVSILDGLDDGQLRMSCLPSGWTPIGLIKHLGYAERYWFQTAFHGSAVAAPWPDDDEGRLTSAHPVAEVIAFYSEQCELSNDLLASTPLESEPLRRHLDDPDDVASLRGIVLHMIEETARHLGHLDVAREMLDGTTGLAPRP